MTTVERQRRTLRQQNDQFDGFAAAVSHELRNLLAITEGYNTVAADALATREVDTASDAIQSVDEATDRMVDVVGDLAMLARLSRTVSSPSTLDFPDAVEEVWSRLEAPDVRLDCRGEGTVVADPERFSELLRNAARLAVESGAMTLAVTLTDDGFVLESDGEGMGDAEEFFSYGAAVPNAESGMLGPNIQAMARAHGWTVDVTESGEAGGIRLRIASADVDRA